MRKIWKKAWIVIKQTDKNLHLLYIHWFWSIKNAVYRIWIKGLLHDQTKFHKLLLKSEFVKSNPSVQCLSLGREGVCLYSNGARRDGISHLRYICHGCGNNKVENEHPCEVIAEAGMRWKYILLTSQSLMFLCSESLKIDCFRMVNQTFLR